jgi:hypothetical protein
VSQHKLVIVDFYFWVHLQYSKRVQASMTKWWKLREETVKTLMREFLMRALDIKEVM